MNEIGHFAVGNCRPNCIAGRYCPLMGGKNGTLGEVLEHTGGEFSSKYLSKLDSYSANFTL